MEELDLKALAKKIGLGILVIFILSGIYGSFFQVPTGSVGFVSYWGSLSPNKYGAGLNFKVPFITNVLIGDMRSETIKVETSSYSKDQQALKFTMKYTAKLNEDQFYYKFTKYNGSIFQGQVEPKIFEALKEIANKQSAEQNILNRDQIKIDTLALAKVKIGGLATLEDINLEDVNLSPELDAAIEAKMIEEQNTKKALYTKQIAQTTADAVVITAEGNATALRKMASALRENPDSIQFKILEKWDGASPQTVVIGGGSGSSGTNLIFPIGKTK